MKTAKCEAQKAPKKKDGRRALALAAASKFDAHAREMAELAKLPRKRLLAEAASARINLRGWMNATNRAWDIVEEHGLRPDPYAETLTQAVERNLLTFAKIKDLFSPNGADHQRASP